MNTNTQLKMLVLAVSFALTACGGGGSSDATVTPVTPPVTPPSVVPADLVLSVPTPTYATNSVEAVAFSDINAFRASVGLGLWAQNALLDKAAQNHNNYQVLNSLYLHTEDSSKLGFTGANPSDRSLFVGSGISVGEVMSISGQSTSPVKILINTVYHRSALADQSSTDVGIDWDAGFINPVVIDYGTKKPQKNASNFTFVYPLANQTDVQLAMFPETPNPVPDLPLAKPWNLPDFGTYTSSPVSFSAKAGTDLKVVTFNVSESGVSIPLDMRLLTKATDPQKLLQSHEAYVIGTKPFKASTTYTASFVGEVNGVAVNKTWSFTTTAIVQ